MQLQCSSALHARCADQELARAARRRRQRKGPTEITSRRAALFLVEGFREGSIAGLERQARRKPDQGSRARADHHRRSA